MQKTFMMIKPDAIDKKDEIIKILESHDLKIERKNEVKVDINTMQVLLDHYKDVIDDLGKDFNFVGKMFNSFYFGDFKIIPMEVSYIGDKDIITLTRDLAGATNPASAKEGTLRKTFSTDSYDQADKEERLLNNVIHASDSAESAKRELELWNSLLEQK